MLIFEWIAERRIAEAVERGDFDHLPGSGAPLNLEQDLLVPDELRMACRVLRNAGMLPPELEVRREIADLQRLLEDCADDDERRDGYARLACLRLRLESTRAGRALNLDPAYHDRVVDRLSGR